MVLVPAPAHLTAHAQTLPLDGDGFLEGKEARGVLMRSGLDVQTLGTIWAEVDHERRGKVRSVMICPPARTRLFLLLFSFLSSLTRCAQLDAEQFALILGLISDAQAGKAPSLATVNLDDAALPKLS
jgi:hypothetical protein